MRKTKGLTQAYYVQDVCFEAIKAWRSANVNVKGEMNLGEDAAQELSQLVRSFTDAQDRVRIHRGKALPGSLRPEAKSKQVKSVLRALNIAPMPEQQAEQGPGQASA